MSNKIQKSGDFLLSLNTQIVGSVYVGGANALQISINTEQESTTTPLPTYILNIYEYKEQYRHDFDNENINNLSKMTKVNSIKINVSSDTENNNYVDTFSVDTQYMTFTISNPSINDIIYDFKASVSNLVVDNYVVRDKQLELDEKALLVRNVSDFKLECIAGQHRGISAWQMNAKGELTNTERLLYDGAYITSMGYFDTTATELHKANTIIIKSDNLNDNDVEFSGFGARKIKIRGLNATFNEIDEIIELNGTTEVNSVNQYSEVNYAQIIESGSYHSNVGNITIYNGDINGGTITNPQNNIVVNYGLHSNPQYCPPQGYDLHILKISVHSYCEDEAELMLNKYHWILNNANINKNMIKSFHLHGTTSFESDCNFVIKGKERFTITAKSLTPPTGINRVSVNVSGYLKLKTLTRQSNLKKDEGIMYVEGYDTLPITIPANF
tara:strand:+ start:1742 stop:3067 length:1326 start_codon:yes stop_codon:yes gene_type:complete